MSRMLKSWWEQVTRYWSTVSTMVRARPSLRLRWHGVQGRSGCACGSTVGIAGCPVLCLCIWQRQKVFDVFDSKAEALEAAKQSEMVWVANDVNNSWEYKQIPLKNVPKGSAVYASRFEAQEGVFKIMAERHKKNGDGESKGWIAPDVRGEPIPPSPPEPREPYTDEELVDSFRGWWGEWLADFHEDDETCTEERAIKPVLNHLLTV